MSKIILITGSTDGIGLRTVKTLADLGQTPGWMILPPMPKANWR
jgi:NADP-dependent 3-hydroxy acid dehydrogenase YdfG